MLLLNLRLLKVNLLSHDKLYRRIPGIFLFKNLLNFQLNLRKSIIENVMSQVENLKLISNTLGKPVEIITY